MRVDAVAPTMALAIVLGMLFCAGAAPGVETPTKRSDLSALSDKELKAFVKVYIDYQRIRSSYGPTLEKTKDPAQKKQIELEANAKIKRSLDDQGLSVERYNHIFAQVNSNPPLRKKVLQQVEEERQKS